MSIVFTRRKTLVCLVVVLNLVAARAVAIAAAEPGQLTAAVQEASPDAAAPAAVLPAPAVLAPVATSALLAAVAPSALSAPAAPSAPPAPAAPPVRLASARPRPAALVPLYVSLASLQALDGVSTLHALNSGTAVEANPIMRGIVSSPAGLFAVKAGVTGLTIFSAEKLWKKNRTAAIVMMLAVNGGYAAIVAHNYAVSAK